VPIASEGLREENASFLRKVARKTDRLVLMRSTYHARNENRFSAALSPKIRDVGCRRAAGCLMNFNVLGQCKAEPRTEFQMARAIVRLLVTLDGN